MLRARYLQIADHVPISVLFMLYVAPHLENQ
jgi:hypothetical protein